MLVLGVSNPAAGCTIAGGVTAVVLDGCLRMELVVVIEYAKQYEKRGHAISSAVHSKAEAKAGAAAGCRKRLWWKGEIDARDLRVLIPSPRC